MAVDVELLQYHRPAQFKVFPLWDREVISFLLENAQNPNHRKFNGYSRRNEENHPQVVAASERVVDA
jgi:hypothetical protein